MSYHSVTGPPISAVRMLRTMEPFIEPKGPLQACIRQYEDLANEAHDKWILALEAKGIDVASDDPFRIPPFRHHEGVPT